MYSYVAYGLNISSAIALPELPELPKDEKIDLTIRFGSIDWHLPEPLEQWSYCKFDGDTAYLGWQIVGKFLVKGGKEIIIEPFADVEERVMRLPLLGSVLAMVLHQRNFLILHGSAVAIENKAAIFVGAKGQGKSTITATLYAQGHPLITDDIAALKAHETNSYSLISGFPQIKLWPEAVEAALNREAKEFGKIHPEIEKRAFAPSDSFSSLSYPVKKIYVLSVGETLGIKPLNPQEVISSLLANSFIPLLTGEEFEKDELRVSHFRQCVNIANSLPVCLLERPRSLKLLQDTAKLIEADFL